MRKKIIMILGLAVFSLAFYACNLSQPGTPTVDADLLYTQAAQTVQAELTGIPRSPGAVTQIPVMTNTPEGGTETGEPPTSTPTASSTTQPTSTPTSPQTDCEDDVDFVDDVTIPDDTVILPGESFVKTWRLRNEGTCTWTQEYKLIFVDGDQMGALASINLPASVEPDDAVDLSVEMTAPSSPGTYRGDWMLSNHEGTNFGLGEDRDNPFYVQIVVEEESGALDLGSPSWRDPMNSAANWFLLDTPNTKFDIEDGNLVMRAVNPGEAEEWGIATHGSIEDFYMEIKATTGDQCSGLDRYGVLVRAPDPNEGYVYGFSCDGRFRIYEWDGENYRPIQEWITSPQIKTGPNRTNLLGIWLKGDTIHLYANRILIGEYTDNTYDEGRFGLFIGSSNTEDFEVLVDEVSYWILED
jgi:hypothetical protein